MPSSRDLPPGEGEAPRRNRLLPTVPRLGDVQLSKQGFPGDGKAFCCSQHRCCSTDTKESNVKHPGPISMNLSNHG